MPFIDREITEEWDVAGLEYTFQEKSIDWTGYFLNMLPWQKKLLKLPLEHNS